MQRRMDIFIAGENEFGADPEEQWVLSSGHFMGLFDNDWLGIPHTNKMNCLRYAEFNCVKNGKISKTGLFIDILGFMQMAGVDCIPYQTGKFYVYPGPRGHDGLLFEDAPEEQSRSMLRIIDRLCGAEPEYVDCTPDTNDYSCLTQDEIDYVKQMKRVFEDDVIWYGPCGIGASYTLPRYAQQHSTPFDDGLRDNTFVGHCVRLAEGNMGGFFGWPNLKNTPVGGYLGMCAGGKPVEMQVVDIYYRGSGPNGLITENWVYIDFLYWFKQQGLDLLNRCQKILNPNICSG